MVRLTVEEKDLLASVEKREWRPIKGSHAAKVRFQKAARATLRKDRRINIRLSNLDLEIIQKRAVEEGLPYQTLIASLLHKYAAGRLPERALSSRV